MWMFSRTLPRLVDSGTLKMRGKQIQTYLRNINTIGLSQSYSTVLNITKLKHCDRINLLPLYRYANLQTSAKFRNSERGEEERDEKRNIKVIFIKPGGEEIVLFGEAGDTVYEVTLQRDGLMTAHCGGIEMCTTCQVYVDQSSMHLFPETVDGKEYLIGYNPLYWKPNSRLACTLVLTEAMKEVKFGLPPAEHINWIVEGTKETIKIIDKPKGLERVLIRLKRILKRIVGKD